MRAAQQVQRVFIPEIDPGLEADLHRAFRNPLQKAPHIFSHAKNFIDEIDVLDTASNQRVHFLEHRVHAALAKLVAKESLVAESAGPRAPAGKLRSEERRVGKEGR